MRNRRIASVPLMALVVLLAVQSPASGSELPLGNAEKKLCVEFSLDANAGLSGEVEGDGEAEGRAGAEAFGNGVMAKLKVIPGAKLGAEVKGGVVLKYEVCWEDQSPALDESGLFSKVYCQKELWDKWCT